MPAIVCGIMKVAVAPLGSDPNSII